jgi:FkbM family methyltransferase
MVGGMCAAPTTSRPGRPSVLGRVAADVGVTRLFRSVGALALADRLDHARAADEFVLLTLPPAPGQERVGRIKMYTDGGRDTAAQAIIDHGWKGFEEPTPDIVVRTARAFPGLVYDVGANSGIYALLAVEAAPFTSVVAFEPFAPALVALRRNIELNAAAARIEVVEAAVSDQLGDVDLFVPAACGLLETSASLNGAFKPEIAERIAVRSLTLDDHWISTGRPKVSLVKIDTETTEHQVLAGASELTRAERPIIVFEVLPGADGPAIEAFAAEHDLVVVRMTATVATIDCPVAHDPRGWNQVLVPRERLASFLPILEDTRLTISSVDDPPEAPDPVDAAPGTVEPLDDAVDDDPDDIPPVPDEHGRYSMNLSPVEVTAVLAKRAALRSMRSLVARIRR